MKIANKNEETSNNQHRGILWAERMPVFLRGQILSLSCLLALIPMVASGGPINFDPVGFTLNNAAVTPEGYLDVTKAPYSLDNQGNDSARNTTWMQNAINDAYNHNLAVFFPAGTYAIEDQMKLFQTRDFMTQVHVLVGSASGARPVILLRGGNFNDAQNPRPLFYYYCSGNGGGPPAGDPASADKAISAYNMVFRGIDIDLNGKAGAIGIDMHAAQGSTIQDVKVIATGAFAGIQSLCGSGAIHANIHVEGGEYGFYVKRNRPMPVLVGITCIGQTVRAVHFPGNMKGALTIVGFHIEAASGPVFDIGDPTDEHDEHLCLVDGSIKITGGSSATVIRNRDRSVYLRNVYVKNGSNVVQNDLGANVVDNSGNWTHFKDYNFFHKTNRQMINGQSGPAAYGTGSNDLIIGNASAPPSDLISRHLWDEANFPHFEDGNCIFVGPGNGDDAATIQAAIDNPDGKTVFLKKGDYYLKRSLIFKQDTKLIGVARSLSRFHCHSSWFASSTTPMITTPANGADATCLLAWLALEMPDPKINGQANQNNRIITLDWTAGRHSMVREVHFRKVGCWTNPEKEFKRVKISGTGGGRWYSIFTRESYEQGEHDEHRMFYVSGTSEPLSIYALTVEYQESEVYMMELNNCSNVSIYGLKGETDLNSSEPSDNATKNTPILGIVNSDNIAIFGQGGLGHLDQNESNHALIEIAGSSDHIQIANATGGWSYTTGFGIVRDMAANKVLTKNASAHNGDPVALFVKGNPNPAAYAPPSSSSSGGSGSVTIIEIEDLDNDIVASSPSAVLGTNYMECYDVEASGTAATNHRHFKPANSAFGSYITYAVNAPEAGDYHISFVIQKRDNAPVVELIVNDSQTLGSADLYGSGTAYFEEFYFGEASLDAGSNELKLSITSSNAPGEACKIRADCIVLNFIGGSSSSGGSGPQTVIEIEDLSVAASSPAVNGTTYIDLYDVEASGITSPNHKHFKPANNDFNAYVTYQVNAPEAGDYDITLGFQKRDNAPVVEVSANSTVLGTADLYQTGTFSFEEIPFGQATLNAGLNDITVAVHSSNAPGGACKLRLDCIVLDLVSSGGGSGGSGDQEFEDMQHVYCAGTPPTVVSAGVETFVKYVPNLNDYISYPVEFPSSGNYTIYVGFKEHANNGVVRMKRDDGSNLGNEEDLYGAAGDYIEAAFCSGAYFDAGTNVIRFKAVNQNASSGGYQMRLNYIRVELE